MVVLARGPVNWLLETGAESLSHFVIERVELSSEVSRPLVGQQPSFGAACAQASG